MSQAKELEDTIFEQAKAENWQPEIASQYFKDICDALGWDEGIRDAYANGLSSRMKEWHKFIESNTETTQSDE